MALAIGLYTVYAQTQTWGWTFGSVPYNQLMGFQGPYMAHGGMMGGLCPCYGFQDSYDERLSIQQALNTVKSYLASYGGSFEVYEVMEFQYNFYAIVVESNTGLGASELLVNPYTGAVYPEPGPNMMWNTKYGMHMGIWWGYSRHAHHI